MDLSEAILEADRHLRRAGILPVEHLDTSNPVASFLSELVGQTVQVYRDEAWIAAPYPRRRQLTKNLSGWLVRWDTAVAADEHYDIEDYW